MILSREEVKVDEAGAEEEEEEGTEIHEREPKIDPLNIEDRTEKATIIEGTTMKITTGCMTKMGRKDLWIGRRRRDVEQKSITIQENPGEGILGGSLVAELMLGAEQDPKGKTRNGLSKLKVGSTGVRMRKKSPCLRKLPSVMIRMLDKRTLLEKRERKKL